MGFRSLISDLEKIRSLLKVDSANNDYHNFVVLFYRNADTIERGLRSWAVECSWLKKYVGDVEGFYDLFTEYIESEDGGREWRRYLDKIISLESVDEQDALFVTFIKKIGCRLASMDVMYGTISFSELEREDDEGKPMEPLLVEPESFSEMIFKNAERAEVIDAVNDVFGVNVEQKIAFMLGVALQGKGKIVYPLKALMYLFVDGDRVDRDIERNAIRNYTGMMFRDYVLDKEEIVDNVVRVLEEAGFDLELYEIGDAEVRRFVNFMVSNLKNKTIGTGLKFLGGYYRDKVNSFVNRLKLKLKELYKNFRG